LVLSLGTGRGPLKQVENRGFSSILMAMVRSATSSERTDDCMTDALAEAHIPYFRFNPQAPEYDFPLDVTDPRKLATMQQCVRRYIASADVSAQLDRIAAIIVGERESDAPVVHERVEQVVVVDVEKKVVVGADVDVDRKENNETQQVPLQQVPSNETLELDEPPAETDEKRELFSGHPLIAPQEVHPVEGCSSSHQEAHASAGERHPSGTAGEPDSMMHSSPARERSAHSISSILSLAGEELDHLPPALHRGRSLSSLSADKHEDALTADTHEDALAADTHEDALAAATHSLSMDVALDVQLTSSCSLSPATFLASEAFALIPDSSATSLTASSNRHSSSCPVLPSSSSSTGKRAEQQ
jgi:hypothetical protein